jgi:hypothetical protein
MNIRPSTIFLAFVGVLVATLVLWFVTPSSTFVFARNLKPKTIPAFYQGGLQQGSGGKLERDWNAYDSKNLFTPSQAHNTANALMPNEAYPAPEACGSCHSSIHGNWVSSLHAKSATDGFYLKVKESFAFENGEPAVRLCAGCHAPVALMSGEVGLYSRESASSQAGVSCAFCHSVDASHGGNGAYVSNPGRIRDYFGGNYLKASSSGLSVGDQLARWLVFQKPQAHVQDMRPAALSNGQVCQSCHSFTINGVKVQSTWDEWQTSSYAKRGVTCTACHFTASGNPNLPESGEIVNGRSRDRVFAHALGGGSTSQAARAEANVTTLKSAVKLEARVLKNSLNVVVRNISAGHSIPTGVGDLRQLWLEIIARDKANQEVFSSGTLDATGVQETGTVLFHQVLGDARGNPLLRHDIWRVAKVLEDTRILANQSRETVFKLPLNAVSVRVRLLWRDVPATFVQQVLHQKGSSLPVIELAQVQMRR